MGHIRWRLDVQTKSDHFLWEYGPPYKAAMEGKPVPPISGIYLCAYSYEVAILREQQCSKGVKTPLIEIFNNSIEEEIAFLATVRNQSK